MKTRDILAAAYGFCFVMSSISLTQNLGEIETASSAGGKIQEYLQLVSWIFAIAAALYAVSRGAKVLTSYSVVFFLLLLAWLMVTSTYAPVPSKSFAGVFSLAALFLVTWTYCVYAGVDSLIKTTVLICAAIVIISLLIYIPFPTFSRLPEWTGLPGPRLRGISSHPDRLGILCIVGFYLTMVFRKRIGLSRTWAVVLMACFFLALQLAHHRTGMLTLIVVSGVYFTLRIRNGAILLPLFAALATLVVIVAYTNIDAVATVLSRSGEAEELLSGTGRTYIWDLALSMSADRPWFGYGYNSTYYIFAELAHELAPLVGGYVFPHTHNVYIQVLFSGGLPALVLLGLTYSFVLANVFKRTEIGFKAIPIFYLILSFADAGGFFMYADTSAWLLSLTITLMAGARQAQAAESREIGRQSPSLVAVT